MRLFKTVAGLRTYLAPIWHQQGVGLVPTMGSLHRGHSRLIEQARRENEVVIVSIFVNPLQFGPQEDFQQYPRELERDCELCEELGVDVVFAPSPEDLAIAPSGKNNGKATPLLEQTTLVQPPPSLVTGLCATYRPGHFQGVATIVVKLLNVVQPDRAYFGEKDAQQIAIIQNLVKDLSLAVEIRACPTVREESGLAYSSRNQYLTPQQKEQAVALSRSLQRAKQAFNAGERNGDRLLEMVNRELAKEPALSVQYAQLVDPQTLAPLGEVEDEGLLAIAAYLGQTRLIDNIVLRQRQPIIAIDGPAGAGKSTVTKGVAQRLGLLYLDTGAMYRALTWQVLEAGINLEDEAAIAELTAHSQVQFINSPEDNNQRVLINGEDITQAIRTPRVTAQVSLVSQVRAVRQQLVAQQQRWGRKGGIVAEGRDIGTRVFPDAELKIFLTASVQERARRRLQDLQEQGIPGGNLEELELQIAERDRLDSTRKTSPLRKSPDAIEIVTDGLTIETVIEQIVQLYQKSVVAGITG
ncbi:bifunctional pantoate--beta-alanine ligase/(d)CMP kinase [Spirulina subsalsa FACHB-351]|uniref:Bifunctional pantoate ligase/cytidylate kinase n=1 Tax=Spirulina subsalsa FACHB-351 TaxID=234711 RepID=A0ABT3L652_9CYAN|nr:bifunctional pantoate--beta-alanine ligase/(d)CMP kinase [Spirulina subsalsa]MCW6036982.1 bifunctional pantoate--beta-alanine ligase/(d)CMP kinase [Spirulina subsalsa FACHB-351]